MSETSGQGPEPAEGAPAAGPPAGWYPHPTMPGTQAYWDGARWTDHVAPAAPARAGDDGATGAAAKVFLLLAAVAAIIVMAWIADAIIRSTG